MPKLNERLEILACQHNYLLKLPQLNNNLKELNCGINKLTYIPKLNENLEILYCYSNNINILPILNKKLNYLEYEYNPIYNLIRYFNVYPISYLNYNQIKRIKINKILNILHRFRHIYYSLKFKNKFYKWIWGKWREKFIAKEYHPDNIIKIINNDFLESD